MHMLSRIKAIFEKSFTTNFILIHRTVSNMIILIECQMILIYCVNKIMGIEPSSFSRNEHDRGDDSPILRAITHPT